MKGGDAAYKFTLSPAGDTEDILPEEAAVHILEEGGLVGSIAEPTCLAKRGLLKDFRNVIVHQVGITVTTRIKIVKFSCLYVVY